MRPEDYKKNYETSLDSLEYLIEHPYRASFKKTLLPRFINRHLYGTQNSTVFNIATHLCLMGLHSELPKLEETLLGSEEQSEGKPDAQLNLFLEHLYGLFEYLSAHPPIAEHYNTIKSLKAEVEADPSANLSKKKEKIITLEKKIEDHNIALEKLMKLIHQFARENDFPCQLFNLDELVKKNSEGSRPFNKARLGVIEKLRVGFDNNRKYAYIQNDLFSFDVSAAEKERAKTRKIESRLNAASFSISLVVGIGEGLVAGVFAAVTMPMWIALLAIGLPGAIINYFLFRGDSFSILKDIYFGRIWTKPDGSELSRTEKIFVAVSLLFSFGAGASFGFLAFGSALTGFSSLFVPLLALMGLAANPIGLLVLAGFVAIVTAAALFTIFAYLTVNWVRNGGPRKLLNKILNFKKDFINFCKHDNWSELSTGQKCLHIAKKILACLGKFICFAIALAAVIIVNVATIGLFKRHSALIFRSIFHLKSSLSKILSFLITVAMGGIVTATFYGNSILSVLKSFKEIGIKMISAIGFAVGFMAGLVIVATLYPKHTLHTIKNGIMNAAKISGKAIWRATKKTGKAIWKKLKSAYSACKHPITTYKNYKIKKQRSWEERIQSISHRESNENNTNYVKRFYTAKSITARAALLPMVAANGFGQGYGAGTDIGAQQWTRGLTHLNHLDASIAIAGTKIPGSAGANGVAVINATATPPPLNEEACAGVSNISDWRDYKNSRAVDSGLFAPGCRISVVEKEDQSGPAYGAGAGMT